MTSEMVPCIPYKGSKRKLARRLISYMPSANTFYDLFAGGGAATSAAILSGRYNNFVMNDITLGLTKFYRDVIEGKYHNRHEWVSREDFFNRSSDDCFKSVIWSFGNNCRCYIYGREVEHLKKALHYAIVYDDYTLLKDICADVKDHMADIIGVPYSRDKYLLFMRRFKSLLPQYKTFRGAEHLERIQGLTNLNLLTELQEVVVERGGGNRLTTLCGSYDEVPITDDDCVIYCDIPYIGTNGYDGTSKTKATIDYDKFYDWVRNSKHLVFISEYRMPDDFVCVSYHDHTSSMCAIATNKVVEKLFVHKSKLHLVKQVKPKQQELFV